MTSDPKMSLSGFKSTEWPDVLAVKMIYNDVRAVTAVVNEGVYTYRMNSVFDPDFTGVGGQPEGFDQLKALYSRYRVIALGVKVTATSLTSGNAGVIAMAPSENSALSTTAEQLGGLRNSRTAEYAFGGGIARMNALYHIGALLGYSDASVLANSNLDAAIAGNPGFQQYLWIQFRDSAATGAIQLGVRLTYYVRMEVPISVVDTMSKMKFKKLAISSSIPTAGAAVDGGSCGAPRFAIAAPPPSPAKLESEARGERLSQLFDEAAERKREAIPNRASCIVCACADFIGATPERFVASGCRAVYHGDTDLMRAYASALAREVDNPVAVALLKGLKGYFESAAAGWAVDLLPRPGGE